MIDTIDLKGLGITDPINTPLSEYRPGNNSGSPRYRVYKGNTLILYISQTLIKQFTRLEETVDFCGRKIYHEYMINDLSWPPTGAMRAGSYFETHLLGSGANGAQQLEYHKKGRGGKMSVEQVRIDEQIFKAKTLLEEYGGVISDDCSNVQVKTLKPYEQDKWVNVKIFLTGEADLITPLTYYGKHYDSAIIDYKLTGNLHSTFGDFGWGKVFDIPKNSKIFMDLVQSTTYHLLFDMPFAYWVFDYKSKDPGPEQRLVFVNHDVNHPDPVKARDAKFRLYEFHQRMNIVINKIVHQFQLGWPTNNSSYDRCAKCGLTNCPDKNNLNEI